MKKPRRNIILYPFSLLYGLVIAIRNWLFDQEIFRSTRFNIPVISVGNLAAGGTGKTPHAEFILSILKDEWKSAVLSRGYKRSTKGFILADQNSTASTLGDEPFQIQQKFSDVTVAVDEKRVHGVKKLQELIPDLQLVVLDDAFQHRYIEPGLSILLTDIANLYSRDLLLPAGNLREWRSGSKRADIIVVTKCPDDFKPIDMRLIETELKIETNQLLFFSNYVYDEIVPVFPDSLPEKWNYEMLGETKANILLVAGIVSPQSIVLHLNKYCDTVKTLFFDDHHAFQPKDFNLIFHTFDKLPSTEKIVLVTEKDASRMVSNPYFPESLKSRTFALPIRVKILHNQENIFIQKIKDYVIEDSRNS
ncbi:MAG: tetraacyldisaccharide 4'-kinase [Paludibacter sp.]|nr:tetraacyldisaccharide 4'-kinase [Paludibacter sp.]